MQQDVPAGTPGHSGPLRVQWEVVKHQKYSNGSLSQVSCLYTIKVYNIEGMFAFSAEPVRSVLLRINPSIDCVLLNKAVSIEVLDGVMLRKFSSKKRNYVSRLQDLSKYFEDNLGITLPESIRKSFVKEFGEAAKLLKGSFSV
ncbi:hypothetical protein U370_04980 [Anaplasma marginale str. Dawn]|uniref:Uncharacterized protein n=2 Tax=Anaplasma marginale TaxID=770 RepID=B9KHB6_ANAMF|nr:hypothetical protein [Anaplasma marginale]ACM49820.1 Conserved hypothetical protein [Anaplasma marginale str. Florida]AGZ79274.1 hypothetical protein U128_05195 [Anaplasma marginale str. Gypsy Plains]AGZ80067.1 hypothetical protein U370_04980 [Anaplasma marginale str. Dawn]AXW84481.1 hypothetical protein CQZ76_05110 [Anaplasma marginale]AXW85414.1 hypothetical protein BKM88_05090 [Anaplasma marginale]